MTLLVAADMVVTSMHEQVYYGTQQHDQPRQRLNEVGSVLGQQKVQNRPDQSDSRQAIWCRPEL